MTDGPTTTPDDDTTPAHVEQVFQHKYPFNSEEIIIIIAALVGGPAILAFTGAHNIRVWALVGTCCVAASFWLYRIGASRKKHSQVTARLKGSYLRVSTRLNYVGNTEIDLANVERVNMKPDAVYPLVVMTSDERTARVPARLFGVPEFHDAVTPYLLREDVEVSANAQEALRLQ